MRSDGGVVAWGTSALEGDNTFVVDEPVNDLKVHSNAGCFAVITEQDNVVTWGSSNWDKDTSAVESHFIDVQELASTDYAFGALLGDGSVPWDF